MPQSGAIFFDLKVSIMNKPSIATAVLAAALAASLAACTPREDDIGPAQKAGKAIDNAGDKVARELQEKLEKADQAGREAAEAARNAGDEIADATGDAQRGLGEATKKVGKKVERAGEEIQDAAKPD